MFLARVLGVLCLVASLAACPSKKASIAELKKADGPVERQEGNSAWKGADIGTKYYLGDAARTADGGAQLSLTGTAQTIAMQPHTVLRFAAGKNNSAKISLELGTIDVTGAGNVGLDIGDVKLGDQGTIRITAKGKGEEGITLTFGAATIATLDGKTLDLELNKEFDLGISAAQVVTDAGVDAAPIDAPVDAGPETPGEATIEVTGKHAELLPPGETKWEPLPAGAGTIAKGAKLRLGLGTTAKLTSNNTTLELGNNSRLKIGDDLLLGMELGSGKASTPGDGKVGVPGGEVDLKGTPQAPAEARIDVGPKGDAKVAVLRGTGKLVGANGAALDLNRDESATLLKQGTINPGVVIPNYFDFKVTIGETPNFYIHDPKGATALQFFFNGKCSGGGQIEMDHDAHFRTPRVSRGTDSANMLVGGGGWVYRLRCGDNGPAVSSGRISVLRDGGTRRLPPPPNYPPIDTDGRTVRMSYQSQIPNVKVKYGGTGSSFKLHIATGGVDQTFDSTTPTIEVPGKQLKEGSYTFWVEAGATKSKVSNLIISFDQTAAQVYIESPPDGQPWAAEIDVRGASLAGWTASINGLELPVIDKTTRRFGAKVQPPTAGNALAIRLSHPKQGIHYYLRRGSK